MGVSGHKNSQDGYLPAAAQVFPPVFAVESIPKVHFLRIVFLQEDRYKAHYLDYSESMLPS